MPTPTEDEDYDDGGDLHLQPINYNASRDELIAALKSSQLSLMKVLGENRELQKTNSELMAVSTKKRRKGVEKDLLGYQPHITALAKKFLFTRALFIDSAIFRLNLPQPSERPEDRFVSDEAYRNSVTIALYQDIPEKFHSLLDAETYGSFAKDFIHEHSDGRSTLISIIRKTLPVILKGFNIDSDLLTTAGADRSNNEALKHFLCFPNERKATLYAPVLFPGPTRNMNELFTGPVVMKTRFVLSPDKEWGTSKTDWEAEYRAYHKLLACNRHLPHVKRIFKKIHSFVFDGIDTSNEATTSDADSDRETEDAIADAMRQFELGTDPASVLEDDADARGVVTPVAEPVTAVRQVHFLDAELPPEPPAEAQNAVPDADVPTGRRTRGRNAGAIAGSGEEPSTTTVFPTDNTPHSARTLKTGAYPLRCRPVFLSSPPLPHCCITHPASLLMLALLPA
ncbi:hypothetical protein DFH09DRAFT_1322316 [Mycena vulgaris]|nr:hypothetical protein DFH09DRAFT_1322316 [Mycena vulgaris]